MGFRAPIFTEIDVTEQHYVEIFYIYSLRSVEKSGKNGRNILYHFFK